MSRAELETAITLFLDHASEGLSGAHWDLYPERVDEDIPLSLTLLYPWIPAEEVTDADLAELREFFAGRPPLEFDLTHLAEFPGVVVYAVPEPDDELTATMRALWAKYPEYPPYGRPDGDPPPHATLGRLTGPDAITLAEAEERTLDLLPTHCEAREVTLMEMYEPDRWRVREKFPFARTGRIA